MSNFTDWYIWSLRDAERYGQDRADKKSLVQQTYTTNISEDGVPLCHLKPTPWKLAVKEMLWFLSGSTDYADLHNSGCTWWAPWLQALDAKTIKSMPVTAKQVPYLNHATAFVRISDELRNGNFDSTRLYASLWPAEEDLSSAVLPPCALAYQVTVADGYLNLTVQQRSADLVCGVPANVIQYAFLLTLYAKIANLKLGRLWFNFGDLHVYKQHLANTGEWDRLLDGHAKASKLAKSKCLFDLSQLSTCSLSVQQADNVKLVGDYEHLGKFDFPVVPVHTQLVQSSQKLLRYL